MNPERFALIAKVLGIVVGAAFLGLVYYGMSELAVILLLITLAFLWLLKTRVKEPLVDERIIAIVEKSRTRASQFFVLILALVILVLSEIGQHKEFLAGLEVSLALLVILNIITMWYYRRKM